MKTWRIAVKLSRSYALFMPTHITAVFAFQKLDLGDLQHTYCRTIDVKLYLKLYLTILHQLQ